MPLTFTFAVLSFFELVYLVDNGGNLSLILFIAFGANAFLAYQIEKDK